MSDRCPLGYLFGNASIQCLDNGEWNASVGTCRKGKFMASFD